MTASLVKQRIFPLPSTFLQGGLGEGFFVFPVSLHCFNQGAKVFHPNVFQCFAQRFSDFRSKAFTALPKGLKCFIPTCSNVLLKGFQISVQKPSPLRPRTKVFHLNGFQCFVQRLSDFRSKALSASPKALTCFAQSLSEFCLEVFVLSVGVFLRIVRWFKACCSKALSALPDSLKRPV